MKERNTKIACFYGNYKFNVVVLDFDAAVICVECASWEAQIEIENPASD